MIITNIKEKAHRSKAQCREEGGQLVESGEPLSLALAKSHSVIAEALRHETLLPPFYSLLHDTTIHNYGQRLCAAYSGSGSCTV
jgi:hypothetical protein